LLGFFEETCQEIFSMADASLKALEVKKNWTSECYKYAHATGMLLPHYFENRTISGVSRILVEEGYTPLSAK